MNITYKLISNRRTGKLVVASEIARGAKKRKMRGLIAATTTIAFSLLQPLPVWAETNAGITLDDQYKAAQLHYNDQDIAIGYTNIANYQKKSKKFGSDITEASKKYALKWGGIEGVEQINNDGFDRVVFKKVDFDALWEIGAVTVYKKEDVDYEHPLVDKPSWKELSLSVRQELIWTTENGVERTIDVYDTSSPEKVERDVSISDVEYEEFKMVAQPEVPFYDFTFAEINDGTLALDDSKKTVWNFGEIKQSGLFIANGHQNAANLVVGKDVDIDVTFGKALVTQEISDAKPTATGVGPKNVYAGKFFVEGLKGIENPESGDQYDGNFNVTDQPSLNAYNTALQEALKANKINQVRYDELIKKGIKSIDESDYIIVYHYDPEQDKDKFLITDEIKKGREHNTILKGSGTQATITIEKGAKLSAQKEGYIIILEDHANAKHYTDTSLVEEGKNAYVDNATYENHGTLVFGYQSRDGVWHKDDSLYGVEPDVVTGSDGHYINAKNGSIFIAGDNSALQVVDEGNAKNEGTIYVASADTSSELSRGVIVESGQFINDKEAEIYLGWGIDESGKKVLRNVTSGNNKNTYFDIDKTNNAIEVSLNSTSSNISIINNGRITLGEVPDKQEAANLNNGAAFNIEYTYDPEAETSAEHISITNNGTIDLGGQDTVGIKVKGNIKSESGTNQISNSANGVINVTGEGSTGLLSIAGATLYNYGVVNVGSPYASSNTKDAFRYGVRAETATVILEGKESKINLLEDNAVGVFARNGGLVKLGDGLRLNAAGDGKKNQIYYWIAGVDNETRKSSAIDFGAGDMRFEVNADASTIFRVDQAATFTASDKNANYMFTVNGDQSQGFYVANRDTIVETNGKMALNVAGDNATGIYVTSGAGQGSGRVILNNDTTISVSGKKASAVVVDGNNYNINGKYTGSSTETTLISYADLTKEKITSLAEGAVGYKLINKGVLDHQGTIDFSDAKDATGIYINGGTLDNKNTASVLVNGIGVDIYGKNSKVKNVGNITANDGIAAVRLNENATLTVEGKQEDSSVILGQGHADGIRVHKGATLTLKDADIRVEGEGGSGLHFMNMASDSDAGNTFRLTGSGVINVVGNNTIGITVEGEDQDKNPAMGNGNFDSSGSERLNIIVKDEGGHGIVTNTSGYVHSGASVKIESDEGQSALIVKGKTNTITQSGLLESNSLQSDVVDLTALQHKYSFVNEGTIRINNDLSTGLAVNGETNGDITFKNGKSGYNRGLIKGGVSLGDGDNTVVLYGGSQVDTITSGSGDNHFILSYVSGENESMKLFDHLKAGDGNDLLELAAKSLNSGASHFIYQDSERQKIDGFETLKVSQNSVFELKDIDIRLNESSTQGGIEVVAASNGRLEKAGTLLIYRENAQETTRFDHYLKGDGVLKTDLNGHAFTFNDSQSEFIGDHFTGALWLENSTFNIKGSDTKALSNATLYLGKKGKALVEENIGIQAIGGITFGGGELTFKDNISGVEMNDLTEDLVADGSLNVNQLRFTNDKGQVNLNAGGFINKAPSMPTSSILLEQDDGRAIVKLVGADEVFGSVGNVKLVLETENGKVDGADLNSVTQTIEHIGEDGSRIIAGEGKYGYGLQTTSGHEGNQDKGLYVAYKLTELELIGKESESVALNNGQITKSVTDHPEAYDFSAKITGSGDLAIESSKAYVGLSNGDNDYSGNTEVRYGTLKLNADHVLGNTALLAVSSQGRVDFRAIDGSFTSQTVGRLTTDNDSSIDLGEAGELIILGDADRDGERISVIRGELLGGDDANLKLTGDRLLVESKNREFKGAATIASGAKIHLYDATSLGVRGDTEVNGELIISNSVTEINPNIAFSRRLTGDGDVRIEALDFEGAVRDTHVALINDNSAFEGQFIVGNETMAPDVGKSKLSISKQNQIGDADMTILDNGTLHFAVYPQSYTGSDETWTVDNHITGSGIVEKTGGGTLTLTQNSANYTGDTFVKEGLLVAGGKDADIVFNTEQLRISQGAGFSGFGELKGSVYNEGSFYVGRKERSLGDSIDTYYVEKSFYNRPSGIIYLSSRDKRPEGEAVSGNIGNILAINGDYIADGGAIVMNTVLNKGHSQTITDQMIVGGNVIVAENNPTQIYVQYAGGLGGFTDENPDAIKLVDVGGVSSHNAFKLGAPVTLGVYEYVLHKGHNDESWYLDAFEDPTKGNTNPKLGAYLANTWAAFDLFRITLHDRMGNIGYSHNLETGEHNNAAWGRMVAGHEKYDAGSGLSVKGDHYLFQVGSDVATITGDHDATMKLGWMAAYGNSDFTSRSNSTGTESRGKIDRGYSLGIYGTWYQADAGHYIDAWAQYARFKNSIYLEDGLKRETNYNSDMVSLSLEGGYSFNLKKLEHGRRLVLQPQAQLIYSHLNTNAYRDEDSALEAEKTRFNNLHTRLGVRLKYAHQEPGSEMFEPYAEFNWLHDTLNDTVTFNEKFKVDSDRPKNRFEIKVGGEGKFNDHWSAWGNASYQFGSNSYSGYKVMLGVKYSW